MLLWVSINLTKMEQSHVLVIVTRLINEKDLEEVEQSIKAVCPIIEHVKWTPKEGDNGGMVYGNLFTKSADFSELKSYQIVLERHPSVKGKPHIEPYDESPGELLKT